MFVWFRDRCVYEIMNGEQRIQFCKKETEQEHRGLAVCMFLRSMLLWDDEQRTADTVL